MAARIGLAADLGERGKHWHADCKVASGRGFYAGCGSGTQGEARAPQIRPPRVVNNEEQL
jgi:hypothetical protein